MKAALWSHIKSLYTAKKKKQEKSLYTVFQRPGNLI